MKEIKAYVTEDNTLFRSEVEAKVHETKKRVEKKLDDVCWGGMITFGIDMYNFVNDNRDLVMEVLGVSYDYMAQWRAERNK